MKTIVTAFGILAITGCGVSAEVRISNPEKKKLSCLTELGNNQESFSASDSFSKQTETRGFVYVSCQKQDSGDTSTITAEVYLNGTLKSKGSASDEFGIATASGYLEDNGS